MYLTAGLLLRYTKDIIQFCNTKDWSHLITPDMVTSYLSDGQEGLGVEESEPVEIAGSVKNSCGNNKIRRVEVTKSVDDDSDEDFSTTEDITVRAGKDRRRKRRRNSRGRNEAEQLIFMLEI